MLWITLCLALLRLLTASGTDFESLVLWTHPLHQLCTNHLHGRHFDPIYQGLLCGESRLPTSLEILFKQTGLYHLIIVSGSHFVFLEQGLNIFFKKYTKSKIAVYILFAATCQFNPPAVRALISLLLQGLSKKYHLFWRAEQTALYSGLGALIIFPEWWISHSLLLSWLASLALCFSRKIIFQHFLIFFFIFPILFNSSFFSVLNNVLVAPLFSYFYFPMSVVTALLPYGASIGNPIWRSTLEAMKYLPFEPQQTGGFSSYPFTFLWLYIFSLHISKRTLWRRRSI
jgi:predicted membrane metal-binding protein